MEPRRPSPPAPQAPVDPSVAIIVEDPLWRRLIPGVERIARRAATLGGGAHASKVGTVLLTNDHAVRVLNARHRGRNKPTNVLTFEPAHPDLGGDIVLAYGIIKREAAAARRRPAHHLAHLVLHGALHLRGHDHAGAGDARRMEREETRLLARMRVPNPWRLTR